MGLDSVEIVLRIEETFGVDLPDEELGSVATVGDLYRLLLSKLDGSYACLSSRAFYRVRKAMVDVLELKRRAIRPSTELDSLLLIPDRIANWKRMEKLSGLRFPRLEHPKWFHWSIFLASTAVYLTACLLLMPVFIDFHVPHSGVFSIAFPFAVGVVFVPVSMAILRAATPYLAYTLPVATVGDLARSVLSRNYPQLKRGASPTQLQDEQEIFQILRGIIVDQLQVDENIVTLDADIARDLGCD